MKVHLEPALAHAPILRIALAIADPAKRAALAARLAALDYAIADDADDADVVLTLGSEGAGALSRPTVSLGGADLDQAGLLGEDASDAQLDAALRAAAAGLSVRVPRNEGLAPLVESVAAQMLTPREVEVLTAIADGLGNKAIARKLDISLHTVKFHIESIFRKLAVRSRAEAVARGLERLQL